MRGERGGETVRVGLIGEQAGAQEALQFAALVGEGLLDGLDFVGLWPEVGRLEPVLAAHGRIFA